MRIITGEQRLTDVDILNIEHDSGVGQQMVNANPDQSVNFFLHNPHEVYERFRRGAIIYGPFGGP